MLIFQKIFFERTFFEKDRTFKRIIVNVSLFTKLSIGPNLNVNIIYFL